jgi:periplasmic divalent cation tolerance protein
VEEAEEARVVLVTHPEAGAEDFAAGLVERRLAACVNLLPVRSVYRWQGAVERAPEVLLVVKTVAGRLPALERHLRERHPYDVPECVALDPVRVEPGYRAWLVAEAGERGA